MRAFSALTLLAATATLASAGATMAGDQGRQPAASTGRAVLICDTDAATRRAFVRDHGAAPVFITAREARSVRPSDPAWSAPRCMTEREHAKLRDAGAGAEYARVP
jgi:hypothetical protein